MERRPERKRTEAMTPRQALKITEAKIMQARKRWIDTTSPSEAAMCERFVNRLLDRWRAIHDTIQLEETERSWGSTKRSR